MRHRDADVGTSQHPAAMGVGLRRASNGPELPLVTAHSAGGLRVAGQHCFRRREHEDERPHQKRFLEIF
ncbi:unnamed protein product [Gadus morhua 'NCC']